MIASEWQARVAAHEARVGQFVDAFLARRSRGQKHPVHDFLFTYYSFSPSKLRQWVPAIGETLEITSEAVQSYPWLEKLPFTREGDHWSLLANAQNLDAAQQRAARFIHSLQAAMLSRPPRFSCFGLHEWAMVYQQPREEIRHQGFELRLSPAELARFVESQTVCCTHYDAFRFFTPAARPLNTFQPHLDSRVDLEQSGCLHANMDLYKWTGKLWPWVGSELLADAFLLAREGRDLDMRASPYELSHLGYIPIPIETPEGREDYRRQQQALQERSLDVRQRLTALAKNITHS